jgi:hypothetical protein
MTSGSSKVQTRLLCAAAFTAILYGISSWAITPWLDTRYPRKPIKVAYLFEACSAVGQTARGDIRFFDCESYVYGILDSALALQSQLPLAQRACFPKDLPPWRLLEIVEPLLNDGNFDNDLAAPQLLRVLHESFPCGR